LPILAIETLVSETLVSETLVSETLVSETLVSERSACVTFSHSFVRVAVALTAAWWLVACFPASPETPAAQQPAATAVPAGPLVTAAPRPPQAKAAVATSPTPAGGIASLLGKPLPTGESISKTTTVTGVNSLAGILPTVTPTPRTPPTPTPTSALAGRITADQVNLRGGPGTNYPVVGQLARTSTLQIVGRNEQGDWLRLTLPDADPAEGWVSAALVLVDLPDNASLTALPVAAAPPPPVASVGGGGGNAGKSAAELAAATAPGMPGPGNFPAPGGNDPLTGLPLPPGRSGGRPIIVCINNDYAARPQFGTSQADVVYEYLMEGYGITRFSALFYGADSAQVGPVRSARLINYYMGALYDAGMVCSGASDPVRYSLKHEAPFPYLDIDLDDASNTRYTVSIGTDYRTRLRADTNRVRAWLSGAGLDKAASIRGFTFGGLPGGGVPATSITIPYPRATGSQVSYLYDGSGRYLRSLGGAAHLDGNSGAQIAVDNVIVQIVPHEATNIVEDSLGSTSIRLNLFGSGPAIVFREGQAFVGTWRSESRGDTPRFFDGAGNEIALKPGKSWISIVPGDYTIGYQ
jgi:hypothetical protein